MRTIKLICTGCDVEFTKAKNEYNRQIKKGRNNFFCTQSCQLRWSHKHGTYDYERAKKNLKPSEGGDRRSDNLSPFRWFILRAKSRSKTHPKKVVNITVKYLKELFDSQNGKCPFTGWNLSLPDSTNGWKTQKRAMKNASLDRIDNNKGYVEGNVRFICLMANLARHSYDDDCVVEFCRAVTAYKG